MAKRTTRTTSNDKRPLRTTYFAFGSNLDPEQIRERCPSATPIGVARLRGARLAFTGYSHGWGGAVATLEEHPDGVASGVVYRLDVADLRRLDTFEGHPRVYQRIRATVETGTGEIRPWVYVRPVEGHGVPSDAYAQAIARGFAAWGLDLGELDAALDRIPDRGGAPNADGTWPVFVYGSLRRGHGNHRVLDPSGALFVREARTAPGFAMFSLGGFPGVVRDANAGQVVGELYHVDARVRSALDRLESHPRFYRRSWIRLEDHTLVQCYLLGRHQVEGLPTVEGGDWSAYQRRGVAA